MTLLKHGLLASCLSLCTISAYSVEPLIETPSDYQNNWIDDILDTLGADGDFDPDKSIDLSFIPTAYYTPEKSFGGGVLMVGLYQSDNAKQARQPSSLIINSFASVNGSYGVKVENMNYFNQDSSRLKIESEAHNEAMVSYGQGFVDGSTDTNKIEFNEVLYSLDSSWQQQLTNDVYLGLGGTLMSVKAQELTHQSSLLDNGNSAGLYANISHDSRDYRLNPSKGWLAKFETGQYLESTTNKGYGLTNLEVAHFINLAPTPGLIAWQVQAKLATDNTPWYHLPDLGGSKGMRGYIKGRYKDKHMLMAQAEYRLPIYQRYGMVFWAAAGSLGGKQTSLADEWLTSVGTGFRVRIKDRINFRADIGKGKHETHFYLNVNEAF